MKRIILIVIGLILFSFPVYAHPGRTDKYGCHTCKTKCEKWGYSYGEYHCHNDVPITTTTNTTTITTTRHTTTKVITTVKATAKSTTKVNTTASKDIIITTKSTADKNAITKANTNDTTANTTTILVPATVSSQLASSVKEMEPNDNLWSWLFLPIGASSISIWLLLDKIFGTSKNKK